MGTSTVTSTFVAVAWVPSDRLGHTSTLYAPAPAIATVNTVNNQSPGSAFRITTPADIVITGTNLDLVTAIQFEDYGIDNVGWPTFALSTPSSTPLFISPDPADPFFPVFTIDSPTQITIASGEIDNMLINYWIFVNTWYKLVLTY